MIEHDSLRPVNGTRGGHKGEDLAGLKAKDARCLAAWAILAAAYDCKDMCIDLGGLDAAILLQQLTNRPNVGRQIPVYLRSQLSNVIAELVPRHDGRDTPTEIEGEGEEKHILQP
jgi:hypothetical protein